MCSWHRPITPSQVVRVAADIRGRPLRERIGGRWAVSLQGYLILLPLSVVFGVTTIPAFHAIENLAFGIAVSLIGYGATGAVLWLASVTLLRHRRERAAPLIVVMGVAGVAWALRSAVFAWSIEWAGLPSSASPVQRLVFGFVLGTVVVPVMAWILDGLAEFRDRRDEALTRLVEERVSVDRQAAYVEAMRAGLVDQVSASLSQARSDVDDLDLSSASMPQDAIDAMERVSRDAIRQVSRETWQEGRKASRVSVGQVVGVAAATKPFQLWIIAFLAPFWAVAAARTFDVSVVSAAVVASAVFLATVIIGANALVPRATGSIFLSYAAAVVLLGGVGGVTYVTMTWLVPSGESTREVVQVSILASVTVVVAVPMAGLAHAVGVAGDRSLDVLRESITAAEVRREALAQQEGRLRQEIAIALHGTVGANLTAATMRLRKAIDDGDVTASAEALAESRRLLDVDLHTLLLREDADLVGALTSLADQWFGLVEISMTIDPRLQASSEATQAVVDVVTEGISNAVGHGGATRIDVTVTGSAGETMVVLEDDGAPFVGGQPGLGTRMLDAHARGRWERVAAGATGSRLVLRLPA